MLLYVVACCCMLLHVVVGCCMLLHVVLCRCMLFNLVVRCLTLYVGKCCCMLLYVVVCCCMLLPAGESLEHVIHFMFKLSNRSHNSQKIFYIRANFRMFH